jgi:hypothetical protein
MSGNFSLPLGVFLFATATSFGAEPAQPPPADGYSVLLLRNGQVLEGRVERDGGGYTVTSPDQEFHVRAAEVEFSCRDLREGYQQKKAVIQRNNIEQHLQLFVWCERHGLLDCAEEQLKAAEALDSEHPMISVLRRRLKVERQQTKVDPIRPVVNSAPPPSDDILDRMTREMPPGTVERFVRVVQPILLNHCPGAIGFALPGGKRLQLMRPPLGEQPSRRITQRNLYAVLQCVDMENPGESPLLKASVGTGASVTVGNFPGKFSAEYEQLNQWVYQVAQRPIPAEELAGSTIGASFSDLADPAGAGRRPIFNRPGSRLAAANPSVRGGDKALSDADESITSKDPPQKPASGGRPSGTVRGARKKATEKAIDAIDPYDPATFNNQANAPTELPTPAARVLNGAGK